MFDAQVIDVLRGIFADVCTGAHATLVRMEGEDDHVHLLVLKRLSAEGTDVHVDRNSKDLVWRLYLHDPEGNNLQVNAI